MARRRPLIAGNWKMNLSIGGAVALAEAVKERLPERPEAEVLLCPPTPYLLAVSGAIAATEIGLGAQDCSGLAAREGAYTGDASAFQLASVGCRYAIVGHSERRRYHFEDAPERAARGEAPPGGGGAPLGLLARKLFCALAERLRPILCVGETLEERERGETAGVVAGQLERALFPLGALEGKEAGAAALRRVDIAYEPVWAIGTGRTATPAQAAEVHAQIRALVAARFGAAAADEQRILYGGSVTPENAEALLREPDIDGALVGGASLKADQFARIVAAAR